MGLIIGVCCRVDGKGLVVTQGVDGALVDESGMVHGAVVDNLHQGFVFVCDGGIVDVDETVRAS